MFHECWFPYEKTQRICTCSLLMTMMMMIRMMMMLIMIIEEKWTGERKGKGKRIMVGAGERLIYISCRVPVVWNFIFLVMDPGSFLPSLFYDLPFTFILFVHPDRMCQQFKWCPVLCVWSHCLVFVNLFENFYRVINHIVNILVFHWQWVLFHFIIYV